MFLCDHYIALSLIILFELYPSPCDPHTNISTLSVVSIAFSLLLIIIIMFQTDMAYTGTPRTVQLYTVTW